VKPTKVIQINSECGRGSTGKIAVSISKLLEQHGIENKVFYSGNHKSDYPNGIMISGKTCIRIHQLLSRIFGDQGFHSSFSTLRLIRKIKKMQPDVILLHNLHGYYLNLSVLFKFLKRYGRPVYWVLHDCWTFTGHCTHFTISGCDKWKTGCFDCPYNGYPKTYFDCSEKQYKRKKELFSGIHGLSIVTPSLWLKSKVEDSFLKDYPIHVINNGIDLSVFKPCSDKSVLDKYGITTKYSVLGVSYGWDNKKGLDAFISLSETLGDKYTVVLVGTDESIEKNLPKNIVAIRRTQNQKELALLYSVADVFVNPTLEDTFPTVNMEALACGTPIAAYKTGGSVEIPDNNCGFMVEKRDILGLEKAIRKICEEKPFSKDNCKIRAKSFDKELFENKYMDLYRSMI